MPTKLDCQSKGRNQLRRRLRIFSSKMTKMGPSTTPYERMDDAKKKARISDDGMNDKENNNNINEVKVKDKKVKKRSWKRFRQVALTTCRYIGIGVAHMSPATVYSSSDYYIDPKNWNKSFSPSYKHKPQTNYPHWSGNLMFTAGW